MLRVPEEVADTFPQEKCFSIPGISFSLESRQLIVEVFKLCGREVSEGTVASATVIEALDVRKDLASGVLARWEASAIDAFDFQRTKERFHRGIIVAAAFATHAGNDTLSLEQLAVSRAGILHPAIGMMDQPLRWPAMHQGHGQGCGYQLSA